MTKLVPLRPQGSDRIVPLKGIPRDEQKIVPLLPQRGPSELVPLTGTPPEFDNARRLLSAAPEETGESDG